MPGIFDSLLGGLGSLFGGGSSGDASGGFDWNSIASGGTDAATGGFDWGSLATGGGGGTGGIDWGNIAGLTDLGGSGTPMDFSNVVDPLVINGAPPASLIDQGGIGSVPGLNFNNLTSLLPYLGGGGGGTPKVPAASLPKPQATPTQPAQNPAGNGGISKVVQQITGSNGTGVLGSGMNIGQLLGLGGIGSTLLAGPGKPAGSDELSAMAKNNQALLDNQIMPTALANQQGQVNGVVMNQFEDALGRKQAAIRRSYGDMGMSGSSMEAADLNAARDASTQGIMAAAQEMAKTGLSLAGTMTGQQVTMYNDLMQAQIAQDKEYRDALAAFAAAAAGETKGTSGGTGTPAASSPAPASTPLDVSSIAGLLPQLESPSPIDISSLVPNDLSALTQYVANDPSLIPNDLSGLSAYLGSPGT